MINNEKKLKKVIRDIVKEAIDPEILLGKTYLPPDKHTFKDNKYPTKDEYLYVDEPDDNYQKFCLVGPVQNGRNDYRYLLSLDNNKYMLEYQKEFYSQKMSSEDFVYTNLNAIDLSIITKIPINIIHRIHYDFFNLSNSPNVEFAKNSLILNLLYAPAYYGGGNYISDRIFVTVNKPNIDLSIPSLLKSLVSDNTIWTKDSFAPRDYSCPSKRQI